MKPSFWQVVAIATATSVVAATTTNEYSLTGNVIIPANTIGRVTQDNPSSAVSHTITIGDGATCILAGVNMKNSSSSPISCNGDATIILAEGSHNEVKYSESSKAAIKAGPTGTTLTIDGKGTLVCSTGAYAAGIGGGSGETVGNVNILGGVIVAECKRTSSGHTESGAGIGSGNEGSCGDISIYGGIVTSKCHNSGSQSYGAAIGSGLGRSGGGKGLCGAIRIGPDVHEIVLARGSEASFIGARKYGTCGTICVEGAYTCEFIDSLTRKMSPGATSAAPVATAAVFPDGGDSTISRFSQGGNGKWSVTAFAELAEGSAEGMGDGQLVVYAADTVGGLTNAAPLQSGYEIKSKANAVKVDLEVESNAATQFFRVGFQNE